MQLRNCRQDVYASTWQAAPHAAPTADSTPLADRSVPRYRKHARGAGVCKPAGGARRPRRPRSTARVRGASVLVERASCC